MAKADKNKKSAEVLRGPGKPKRSAKPAGFDPVDWLVRTHPATASWLGIDLTKDRGRR